MTLADALRPKLPSVDVLARELYNIHFRNGIAHCPHTNQHTNGDRNPSLRLDKERIFCASQGCFGDKGSDQFGLVQRMDHVDFSGAVKKLATHLGVESPLPEPKVKRAKTTAMVVRSELKRDGFEMVAEFYFKKDLRKVRFEHRSKVQAEKNRPHKTFRWEHRAPGDLWLSGDGGKPKAIYLNNCFRERCQVETVIGLEGEGNADFAGGLGLPAFSFRELSEEGARELIGLDICLWPDADDAGKKHLQRAIDLLKPYARTVNVVAAPEGLSVGGDIVDAVEVLGWTANTVREFLKTAVRSPKLIGSPDGDCDKQPAADKRPSRILSIEQLRPLREFADQKIQFVLDGFFAAATVNLITGESGSGKTTLVSAICDAVQQGKPFAGLATSRRKVLVLDRENPPTVVRERFDRLGIVDSDDFKIWGGWEIEEPAGPNSAVIIDWVKLCDPKPLLVFDSLIAFNEGDENSAKDTRKCFQGFRNLANLGATVIVIHHSGKAETAKNYRGSSDIPAAVDVGYHVSNRGESLRLGRMVLRAFKARFAVQPEVVFTYHDGIFSRDARVPSQAHTKTLQEVLLANPGIGKVQFEKLGLEKAVAREKIRAFVS